MANNMINMPSGMGGLMRYNEEYKSKLMITPTQVVIFMILIAVFVFILKIFFTAK
ncbi:MAG: preprotein translocase subunit Sec61beta [Candidatus Nanoarchaeia archaeon]|nr:preprotein translocase subunit Sec61beta [Candidatus Nanoarchaeia archaeon]